jgi:hypothetical protein
MQIEVGKYYRNRKGDVHGPMKITASHPDRFTDGMGNWYRGDGNYWGQRPGGPSSLIQESAPELLTGEKPCR